MRPAEPARGSLAATGERLLHHHERLVQQDALRTRAMARDAGVTTTELACLRAVAVLSPTQCTVARIAEHALLVLPTASRLLTKLVDAGDLRREYADYDRRKVFLVLTEQGRGKLERRQRRIRAQLLERLAGLGAAESERLADALGCVVELMRGLGLDEAVALEDDRGPSRGG